MIGRPRAHTDPWETPETVGVSSASLSSGRFQNSRSPISTSNTGALPLAIRVTAPYSIIPTAPSTAFPSFLISSASTGSATSSIAGTVGKSSISSSVSSASSVSPNSTWTGFSSHFSAFDSTLPQTHKIKASQAETMDQSISSGNSLHMNQNPDDIAIKPRNRATSDNVSWNTFQSSNGPRKSVEIIGNQRTKVSNTLVIRDDRRASREEKKLATVEDENKVSRSILNPQDPEFHIGRSRYRSHSDNAANSANAGPNVKERKSNVITSPLQSDSEGEVLWNAYSPQRIRSSSVPSKPGLKKSPPSPTRMNMDMVNEDDSTGDMRRKSKGSKGRGRSRSKGRRSSVDQSGSEEVPIAQQSFNIYDRKVSSALQTAWDAVFGIPFRGSIAYIGVIEKRNVDQDFKVVQAHMEMKKRFSGQTSTDLTLEVKSPVQNKIELIVNSGGYDDGNVAEVFLNGQLVSKNDRGINIVVLDPVSLNVTSAAFDTFSVNGPEEVDRLEDFVLENLLRRAVGNRYVRVVCVAVKDDCTKNLKAKGRRILESMGMKFPMRDHSEMIHPLIENGALPAERTPSLLNLCAKSNAHRCLDLLLSHGWRIDYRPKHGLQNTALHDAIFHDSKEAARCLLQHGANYTIRNKIGETAEDMIAKSYLQTLEEFKNSQSDEMETKKTQTGKEKGQDDSAVVDSVLRVLDLHLEI